MSLYYEIANHMNRYYPVLPNFPNDDDFPFVRLLRKLVTPEEGKCVLCLTDQLISPKQLSVLANIPLHKAEDILYTLSKKGIIFLEEGEEGLRYKLLSICPGLLEAVVSISDDKDISKDVKDFLEYIHHQASNEKVISLNRTIDTTSYKLSEEEVSYYLDSTDSYALTDCACRKLNKNAHKECGHPIKDMCIILGKYADFYVRTGRGRRATRKEVEKILKLADSLGMYHQVFSSESVGRSAFICNCCSCGCLSMWMSSSIDVYLSEEVSTKVNVDALKCVGCKDCARACPAEALVIPEGKNVPILAGNNCFSCGLCEALCPVNAIKIG